MENANLSNSNFSNANLKGVNLQGANLNSSILSNSKLWDINLGRTYTTDAIFEGAIAGIHQRKNFEEIMTLAQINSIDWRDSPDIQFKWN